MGKVYLICGKICSGKSYYAKLLKEKYNAVILSTDEATYDLINNEQGEFYNANQELKKHKKGRQTAQKSRECKYVANKSHKALLRCLRQ